MPCLASKHIYNAIMYNLLVFASTSHLILECIMKIIEAFMEIVHTKHTVYHKNIKKASKDDILRNMLGPA